MTVEKLHRIAEQMHEYAAAADLPGYAEKLEKAARELDARAAGLQAENLQETHQALIH